MPGASNPAPPPPPALLITREPIEEFVPCVLPDVFGDAAAAPPPPIVITYVVPLFSVILLSAVPGVPPDVPYDVLYPQHLRHHQHKY